MSDVDVAVRLAEKLEAAGADSADVLISDAAALSVSYRLGKLESTERAESRDVGLRAIIGQSQAFISGSVRHEADYDTLIARVIDMARAAPPDPFCGLAPVETLATDWPELDLCDDTEPDAEALTARASATEAAALDCTGITNSEGAEASWQRSTDTLLTSHGFSGSHTRSVFATGCAVIAGEGDAMERDYGAHAARHLAALEDPETIGKRAATRSLARCGARKIDSMQAAVVYDRRVSASLIGHLAGALSGSAVARGTSFLRDSMGKPVFPENIRIIDDPTRTGGLGSTGFDGEGLAAKPLPLIAEGRIANWLLDWAAARQLGLESNGRAGRGAGAPPHPTTTNLYMEAGAQPAADLIADIDDGLYVTELIGFGVNGVTGDYSRGASGFRIEKGQCTHPVSEVTIAGNLKDMFARLTPADDLEFRHRVNAPTLRIDAMTVAGH